jgi:argininosuccinate synthase
MHNDLVMAYLGDCDSTAQLTALAGSPGTRVIAVVFDRGAGPSASHLRARALSQGAMRCHVLDVRDAFVREVTFAAARDGVAEGNPRLAGLQSAFIDHALRVVAEIEQATIASRTGYGPLPGVARPAARSESRLELRVEQSEPVAVNGIPMTPGELAESMETITGAAAIDVCCLAYRALAGAPAGIVTLTADHGVCQIDERVASSSTAL